MSVQKIGLWAVGKHGDRRRFNPASSGRGTQWNQAATRIASFTDLLAKLSLALGAEWGGDRHRFIFTIEIADFALTHHHC